MNHLKRPILLACFLNCLLTIKAQGVRDVYQSCNLIPLNSPFKKDTTHLLPDADKYSLRSGSYLLPCSIKALYGLTVEKILLIVYEDTARAISIFLPFDSVLHKRMEKDLGPSEGSWMALEPEQRDTPGMIQTGGGFWTII